MNEQIWPLVHQQEVDCNSCARLAFTLREDRVCPVITCLGALGACGCLSSPRNAALMSSEGKANDAVGSPASPDGGAGMHRSAIKDNPGCELFQL